jgi:neutral/alkaline ceramidase-like enzyme
VKKTGRILLRVTTGLSVLVVLAVVAGLEGVDYRPYFREPYYRKTVARLHAELTTNVVIRGPFAAGFGRARLTPTVNAAQDDPVHGQFRTLPLAGYGNRNGHAATGVHDDLYVKAAALRVGDHLGVMVGADALIIPREVADAAAAQLQRDLGLRREQLYLSATHTHCSLGGWAEGPVGKAFAGSFQPGARTWFAECIAAAVREAVADLKPASFGQGSFDAPEFVRNRLVGDLGRVDPEFSFAVLKQDQGRTAVLGSYAAHATVLSGQVMEFSADYPGYWQRAVEEATGGPAIFLAGGVGSHGPVAGEGGFAGAERMGRALAKRLLDRLPSVTLTNSISFDTLGLDVVLPALQSRLGDAVRLRPWLASRLLPIHPESFVQVIRLEEAVWVSTPCDFSGELALGIKDSLRSRGCRAVITSFNGDYIGYVILPRYYHLNGYEPRTMSFFGPYVPDYLDELIRTMSSEVLKR